jgi:tRNA-dihydrouridine synthase A
MLDRTDRHYRWFMRRITRRSLLYSEMVTTAAVLHGDRERLLGFDAEEKPLSLQLGGDDPSALAACARIAADLGYDEVNLNVGCPSDRVQRGRFGACLMAEPDRVAAAVAAMRAAVELPVTVKHRIGIDELDRYEDMERFVATVAAAGCDRFSVHARKAWLSGLSPKENRTVPPLRYGDVHRLKATFPRLMIEINGGFTRMEQVHKQLAHVDGVMVGRAAYENPYAFVTADAELYGDDPAVPTRREIVEAMFPYVERWRRRDLFLSKITRHMLGLFANRPGTRAWKRRLSERAHVEGAGAEVLREALALVPAEVLDERPQPAARAQPSAG